MEDNNKNYKKETLGSRGQALLRYSPTKLENKRETIEGGREGGREGGGVTK